MIIVRVLFVILILEMYSRYFDPINNNHLQAKVGEFPSFRASDIDTDLPTVSTDLFSGFQYLKNHFIASKWRFVNDTIASSHEKIPFMLKYRFKASKSSVSTNTIACLLKFAYTIVSSVSVLNMSDTVTDTIACIYKNLLNNHKLNIGIVICPIQSLLSVKNLPIHTIIRR